MAKRKFAPYVFWLIERLGLILVKLLGITWRYKIHNSYNGKNVIYAFWHRNILPLLYLHRDQQIVVMISQSEDGELISDICHALGYKTARGSSSRGGSNAIREMKAIAGKNSLAITPDGPKGPKEEFKEGLIFLSRITGLSIVLVAVEINNEIVFNSWDRFRLPLPFSRINVIYDEPFEIERNYNIDQVKEQLSERMRLLEDKIRK